MLIILVDILHGINSNIYFIYEPVEGANIITCFYNVCSSLLLHRTVITIMIIKYILRYL